MGYEMIRWLLLEANGTYTLHNEQTVARAAGICIILSSDSHRHLRHPIVANTVNGNGGYEVEC